MSLLRGKVRPIKIGRDIERPGKSKITAVSTVLLIIRPSSSKPCRLLELSSKTRAASVIKPSTIFSLAMDASAPTLSSTFYFNGISEVLLTLNPTGLSWNPLSTESDSSSCCQMMFQSVGETEIRFQDVYAVEFTGLGLINDHSGSGRSTVWSDSTEVYQFMVHGYRRGKNNTLPLALSTYIFGHRDLQACQTWVDQINTCIQGEVCRPKNLLVFVHPLCGKGNGYKIWETVAPLFSRAKVATKLTVTQRAGHAHDVLKSLTDEELRSFDGIIAVGGDGLFNEILNGLLSSRHKIPYPPAPANFNTSDIKDQLLQNVRGDNFSFKSSFKYRNEASCKGDDQEPLLSTSVSYELVARSAHESCSLDQSAAISFPNDWFRVGIIPAGSTDAVVISTTGMRDPVTSALHIILGKKISMDVAQVVRWKTIPSSIDIPSVHYAASFVGYGFYGDVIKESEKYRWMGPSRYDFTGTKVFLEHRSYEAEIGFVEAQAIHPQENPNKSICRANCTVCSMATDSSQAVTNGGNCGPDSRIEDLKWSQRKGRFLSVGAAIISCRNERAPDGLVADAHLSDGFLHLILAKDCTLPSYLWHLIKLTRRGSNPLDFSFLEHHKTQAFTFVVNHDGSVWNLDGELFQACQVTVRACRGLINIFASGPEV